MLLSVLESSSCFRDLHSEKVRFDSKRSRNVSEKSGKCEIFASKQWGKCEKLAVLGSGKCEIFGVFGSENVKVCIFAVSNWLKIWINC